MAKKTNCIVHGKPAYRLRERIGTALDGSPIYKSFYGSGKLEAERKRNEFLEYAKSAGNTNFIAGTLEQAGNYYTYNILINERLSPSTIELYERAYRRHLKGSRFATKPLREINAAALQQFLNRLEVPPSTLKAEYQYLVRLYRWLEKEGYCRNLMNNVVLPKRGARTKTDEISVFSPDEVTLITTEDNRLKFAFLLALSTGLREGELLALKYSDIKHGAVTVSRQLNEHYRIGSDGSREMVSVLKEPKSVNSSRSVPIPENVMTVFEEHRSRHIEEMRKNGYETDFIFTTAGGRLLNKGNFRHAWKRHLKRIGVPYRKFHACRATYCTLLCRRGVPLETASKLMGHSSVAITAQFYRMIDTGELRSAAEKINDLF